MLQSLHVKNLALMKETEVEFGEGLNILTGETGAGKSLLIGSVNLALGAKFEKDMLRKGAENALVELVFTADSPQITEKLKELELEAEDGVVIISRKMQPGKSICKINGETVTTKQVKELSEVLLDIHGQHEHQSLLYGDRQLSILDVYGKERILPAREKVREAYREYRACMDQLKALDMDEEQRNREKAEKAAGRRADGRGNKEAGGSSGCL